MLASAGVFWFSDTVADPDLWGHVRFGQDLVRTGSIIRSDVYSYRTAGQRWINHEWLSEVVFAGIYDRWGPPGLIVFKVAASLLLVGLCYVHLRRGGLGAYASLVLLTLMVVPLRMGLGTMRPQLFTYLFFLLELVVLGKAARGPVHWLWVLPFALAAWVNLHGGVLAGVGTLVVWILVRAVDAVRDTGRPLPLRLGAVAHLAAVAMACGLALLANPYGAELIGFLLRTATVPRPEIGEWTPLSLLSLPGLLYLILLAIGIAALAGSRRPPRPEAIVLLGLTAILPLVSNRHYPLFALTLVVVCGQHIADLVSTLWPVAQSRLAQCRAVAAASLVVSLVLLSLTPPRLGCIRVEPLDFAFPARAVAFVKRSGFRGNLAVPYDWGEYVLWHLGPGVKVSIDGRRETVYSDESYRQSRDFEHATGVWNALLSTGLPTDLVLASNRSPTTNLLSQADGWLALYQDSFCTIFARAGLPSLGELVRTPLPAVPDDGAGLCFPGPATPIARGSHD
jgi:hypothetical protein